jgi:hypothetical protein
MPSFRKCESVVGGMVADLVSRYYPDLVEADVTFDLLWSFGGQLKLHGYPCRATVKVNSQELRAKGENDVTIKISEDQWKEMSEDQKFALLDHELYHVIVKRDEDGNIKLDESKRPVCKIQIHDWSLGGFAEIARRHGRFSFERQDAKAWAADYEQLLLFDIVPEKESA